MDASAEDGIVGDAGPPFLFFYFSVSDAFGNRSTHHASILRQVLAAHHVTCDAEPLPSVSIQSPRG
jgi:hypothetical protein